jgi:3-oxoadipate enol-lactonase
VGSHAAAEVHLPPGRALTLPGRGTTFVRELRAGTDRPTVVLLHGWAATADLNWALAYEALGEHADVVALDHRGHGRGLRGDGRFTLEACADDVAALLDELGTGPAVVVGYSMGGPVGQLVWRRHPGRVAGLVLCSTAAHFCDGNRDRALFAAAGSAALVARSRATRGAGEAVASAVVRRRDLPAGLVEQVADHDWATVFQAARALGRFDARRWLRHVDVPVGLITTLGDEVVPTRRQLAMAGALRPVHHAVVRGGHGVCLRAGSGFVDALVRACRAVIAGRATAPARAA